MRVAFLQNLGINESLAATEASALLKSRGHEVRMFIARNPGGVLPLLRRWAPDLILLLGSIRSPEYVLEMARALDDSLPIPVVLGGSLPTLWPEILNRVPLRGLIRGEAELALLAGVEALESGRSWGDTLKLPGWMGKWEGKSRMGPPAEISENLDDLPPPDRGLYFEDFSYLGRFPLKKFLASRGCVRSCDVCYLSGVQRLQGRGSRRVRQKSVSRIIAEVNEVRQRWPLRQVHFSDDAFGVGTRFQEEFAARWPREVGLPFACNTLAEVLTEEAVASFSQAGCHAVAVGVEVGDAAVREDIYGKETPDEVFRVAAERLKRHHISLISLNVMGFPGETPERVLQTLDFARSLGARYTRIAMAAPLPGTPAHERAAREGLLDGMDPLDPLRPGLDLSFRVERAEEVMNLFHLFRLGILFPGSRPLLPHLARLPLRPLYQLLDLSSFWNEKRLYGIGLREGLGFGLHAGPPHLRTHNFASLLQ